MVFFPMYLITGTNLKIITLHVKSLSKEINQISLKFERGNKLFLRRNHSHLNRGAWADFEQHSCHLDAEPCSYNSSMCKFAYAIPIPYSLCYWPAFVVPVHKVVSKNFNHVFGTKTLAPERAKYLSCFH